MSKAVLVMDMPDSCPDCPCSFFERSNPKLNLICGATGEDANNVDKPDWCPLRELPKKMPTYLCINDEKGYCEGYNDCIDTITGESEEK